MEKLIRSSRGYKSVHYKTIVTDVVFTGHLALGTVMKRRPPTYPSLSSYYLDGGYSARAERKNRLKQPRCTKTII